VSQEQQDRRIDYIELTVKEMASSKEFYGSVFGWEFRDWGPDYASFNDGRLRGGLRSDIEPRPGGPLVVFYAVDLEAMAEKIKTSGGTIVKEIFDFPGGRRFEFNDPSGNELAVWSDK
jgi:predicted enzyme related to lactoylglutathione lyase